LILPLAIYGLILSRDVACNVSTGIICYIQGFKIMVSRRHFNQLAAYFSLGSLVPSAFERWFNFNITEAEIQEKFKTLLSILDPETGFLAYTQTPSITPASEDARTTTLSRCDFLSYSLRYFSNNV
jgi:hypothetical protein